nr:MAG TPA: hypothetical protein [Caudoviricetes sp.]
MSIPSSHQFILNVRFFILTSGDFPHFHRYVNSYPVWRTLLPLT